MDVISAVKLRRLLSRENHVLVVGENDYRVSVDSVERVDKFLRRSVHRLAAADHNVASQLLKEIFKSLAVDYRDHRELFVRQLFAV